MTRRMDPELLSARREARAIYVASLTIDDVLARAVPEPNSGCWLWERGRQTTGYGCWPVPVRQGYILAHRVAFEVGHRINPEGMMVCHRCDVPSCVNPDHLFLGTQADNMRDCANKGRVRTPLYRGEDHPQAKFTEADIRAIRDDNRTLMVIAGDYAASKTHISEIKRRLVWRHIE